MKITNNHNLPEVFLKAASAMVRQQAPRPEVLYATDLVNPPLIKYLKFKHYDELEVDASELLWALLGTAIHNLLEGHAPDNSLTEERLIFHTGVKLSDNEILVVGRPDVYVNDEIHDYKVTSVYSFLLGEKEEWEKQLNVYAFLYGMAGFSVDKLRIFAILRDWVKRKAETEEDYPPIPFVQKEVPLWNMAQQKEFILGEVIRWKEAFEAAEKGEFKECSDKEKWVQGGGFALYQKNRKRAIRVFETLEQANKIKLSQDQYILERPKTFTRCLYYCPVRAVCPFVPQLEKEEGE